jgi:hypothetical protein
MDDTDSDRLIVYLGRVDAAQVTLYDADVWGQLHGILLVVEESDPPVVRLPSFTVEELV